MERNLAKSLHTISALANVARWLQLQAPHLSADEAVRKAAVALGVADQPDVYGLKAKAAAVLSKGAR